MASVLRVQVHRSAPGADAGATQVVVLGELDSAGASAMIEAWGVELTFAPTWMVLDLGLVNFCDAAGLRALTAVLASVEEHHIGLELLVQPHLAWLLHLVGLDPHQQAVLVADLRGDVVGGRLGEHR